MPAESPTATHSFDLVNITKTKALIGVPTTTVYLMERQGFKGIYKRGKSRFVSKSELEAWIKENGK